MLRRILLPALAMMMAAASVQDATANDGFSFLGGQLGFGFYQPYGIRYSTSVRTPPYFAVNPPVYYGERHYRPYGASPFASLPLVQAGQGYTTRAAGERSTPSLSVPHPSAGIVNPFCANLIDTAAGAKLVSVEIPRQAPSIVHANPFVGSQVAFNNAKYGSSEAK